MLWLPGACSASPDPFAEISNILFEIFTEMLRKKQFWTWTPINLIFDCIKELFRLVITLCPAWFFRAKINKNLWPPAFRFGPRILNALAPALQVSIEIFQIFLNHSTSKRFFYFCTWTNGYKLKYFKQSLIFCSWRFCPYFFSFWHLTGNFTYFVVRNLL